MYIKLAGFAGSFNRKIYFPILVLLNIYSDYKLFFKKLFVDSFIAFLIFNVNRIELS